MAKEHRALADKLTALVKSDPAALQRLLADPKGTAETVNGGPIPAAAAIRIAHTGSALENERDTDIVVRVPEDTELSVEELESVAGGDLNGACGKGGTINAYQCKPATQG